MRFGILGLLLGLLVLSCKHDKIEDPCMAEINNLRINQIQCIGSHNSYRLKTHQPIFDFLGNVDPSILDGNDPREWDYNHLPLPQQLNDFGMRSFELDIYHDPEGGRFYNRQGNEPIGEPTASNIPELLEPGFKLLHLPDVDYMTCYPTFVMALQEIKHWSDANPNHFPIIIMVEPKTETIADIIPLPGFVFALPFSASAVDSIDLEIKSVFGETLDEVITPDDIRKEANTLNEVILSSGWPTIGEARGKILFVLSGLRDEYLTGHENGKGRAMFRFAEPGDPEAAFIKRDSPENPQEIQELVQQGYIIRTRADAGTWEARSGDHSRKEKAFESGAQMISTDYYQPDSRAGDTTGWSNYFVAFPNKEIARFNPVNMNETVSCLLQNEFCKKNIKNLHNLNKTLRFVISIERNETKFSK